MQPVHILFILVALLISGCNLSDVWKATHDPSRVESNPQQVKK